LSPFFRPHATVKKNCNLPNGMLSLINELGLCPAALSSAKKSVASRTILKISHRVTLLMIRVMENGDFADVCL
jgi:hypothetical protein